MANMSTQPRPEERNLRRSVSKSLPRACRGDAPASANGAANEAFFETPCFRAAPQNEVCGRTASTFARGAWRTVLLSGLSAVAIACAASFAFADPLPHVSPEAPPSFGDLADASPLVAVLTARGARDPAPDVAFFAEPRFDFAPGADSAPPSESALA